MLDYDGKHPGNLNFFLTEGCLRWLWTISMQFYVSKLTFSKSFCFLMKFFMSFCFPKQTLCFDLFSHGFLQHFCIWKQKFKSETEKNCIVPIILCKNNQIFCNQLQNVWNCFVVFCKNQLSFTKILKWFDSVKLLKLFVKSHKIFEKWCQNLVIIL